MELCPVEGHRLVAVNQQLMCNSTAEAQPQQPRTPAAEDSAAQQGSWSSTPGSLGPRKWVREPKTSSGANLRVGGPPRLRRRRIYCSPNMAARERSRVRELRQAFNSLQAALPCVPPGTKLPKIDVLVLATNYIAHLMETLDHPGGRPVTQHVMLARPAGHLRPLKKWPMRSLLYCGEYGKMLQGVLTDHFGVQPLAKGEKGS